MRGAGWMRSRVAAGNATHAMKGPQVLENKRQPTPRSGWAWRSWRIGPGYSMINCAGQPERDDCHMPAK